MKRELLRYLCHPLYWVIIGIGMAVRFVMAWLDRLYRPEIFWTLSIDFWNKIGSVTEGFLIVLVLIHLFSVDKESGTKPVINSTTHGRKRLLWERLIAGVLAAVAGALLLAFGNLSIIAVYRWGMPFPEGSYSKSYKMKKRIENPDENRAIFLNVHEAIIDRPTWEKVQSMKKGTRRKKPTVTQEPSVFSGVLKCPECGGNLNFHFNQGNHDIKFFSCQNHNSGLRKCTKTHYIRVKFLEQVVLYEVNRLACFANEYEDDFIKAMMGQSAKVTENDRARKQRELDGLLARDKELDVLFEKLYEDNVNQKINDARFAKMSQRYEAEQGENAKKVKALRLELKKSEGRRMDVDTFLETVRRYTNATEITQRMVAELIDHIDVYHAEKKDGVTTQRITIYYNCIGAFAVPDRRNIPDIEITMGTRKGVAVSYSPERIA